MIPLIDNTIKNKSQNSFFKNPLKKSFILLNYTNIQIILKLVRLHHNLHSNLL